MRTYRKYKLFYRGGAEEARWAHNSEDVGSKPTSGIFHFSCFIEMRTYRKYKLFYRHGAEGARGEHHFEVTRSKRVAGITLPKSYKQLLFI